jgi:hypothetical protein
MTLAVRAAGKQFRVIRSPKRIVVCKYYLINNGYKNMDNSDNEAAKEWEGKPFIVTASGELAIQTEK